MVVIILPRKFQTVNAPSHPAAGFTLLASLLCSPLAPAGSLIPKLETAPCYLILGSAAIQLVGVGLTSSLLSSEVSVSHVQYSYGLSWKFSFEFEMAKALLEVTK